MAEDRIKTAAHAWLETYLAQRGIDTRKPFTCLNPQHEDRHPSMSLDRQRNRVHCFACGARYDIFQLIGLEYGLEGFTAQRQKAAELMGLAQQDAGKAPRSAAGKAPPKAGGNAFDVAAYCRKAAQSIGQTDYLAQRGLSAASAARFGLGFDARFAQGTGGTPWQALIIPTGEGSFTARNTNPQADKRSRIRKHGASPLFNAEALWAGKGPVFVVEGELDAISVCQAGGSAVALGSTANARRLLLVVAERRPVGPLLLALDQDTEGERAAKALAEGLEALAVPFEVVRLPEGAKDPNEALVADPDAFAQWVAALQNAEADARERARASYLQTSAAHHIAAFWDGVHDGVDTPFVPTGFAALDGLLDGGLYEGLYILGAISSLGKTTLALQMADQVAAAGQDVLIFSLEMARGELMAKSISRQTLLRALGEGLDRDLAKTARGITTRTRYAGYSEAEQLLIARAIADYALYAERLYIVEGAGEVGVEQVRQTVARHLEYTGRRPVVLIDYLQILSPRHERATDKQNTDHAVLELKRISRDFKLPVLGISSFNRAGYREAATMEAFKESGAIEYSSDVLIGLQLAGVGQRDFSPDEAKDKNPREVELVVLKNRNGVTGRRVAFAYYPAFNFWKELAGLHV